MISKLDLSKGFHQVPVNPKDMVKTAFVCPWGKSEYRRMPFGLRNAPAVFQLLMEKVLADHREYARTHIDDIFVFSKDWESHLHHTRKVLSALASVGLTANPIKCEWGGRQMLYLVIWWVVASCRFPRTGQRQWLIFNGL